MPITMVGAAVPLIEAYMFLSVVPPPPPPPPPPPYDTYALRGGHDCDNQYTRMRGNHCQLEFL